ncbi:MAG: dienelactone hydrolase family protein [Acholeplasmataceae bacterium]|nr:dienelactone hydrolase family protein [Acholeplasmataceae bacterium]
MQIFEGLMYLSTLVGLGVLIKFKTIKKEYAISILIVILTSFFIHIIIEDTRWQLIPLFVSTFLFVGLVSLSLTGFDKIKSFKIIRKSLLITSSVFTIMYMLIIFSFPVYDMVMPTGDYLIGTESFILTDPVREEAYATIDTNRKIKVQIWYPSDDVKGYDLVPWLEDGRIIAQGLASDMGLPEFILNHTEHIDSNAYQGAPISDELNSYPVVIISHGWRGFRNLHTDLAEELASQGYIAVSIDHTYGSVATVFSEDEVVYLNSDALPDRDSNNVFLTYANQLVSTYAGDISLTIDQLDLMNQRLIVSQFEEKLNLAEIGLLGHSTGAGAGVLVALNDTRIKAVFGMDAWVEPIDEIDVEKHLDVPSLFLRSEQWETGFNNTNLIDIVNQSNSTSYLYQINGTIHTDFSMAYMYSPLTKLLGLTGELDGDYLVPMLKEMIVGFFSEHLYNNQIIETNKFDERWNEVNKID